MGLLFSSVQFSSVQFIHIPWIHFWLQMSLVVEVVNTTVLAIYFIIHSQYN